MAALHSRCGHYILQLWLLSSFLFLSFFSLPIWLRIGCPPYFHTWCGLSANLECRSEMCFMQLTKNTRTQKLCKKTTICTPSHNVVGLYLRNDFGTPQQISTGFVSWLHYCTNVAQQRQPDFAQCLAVSWAGTVYIHFWGLLHISARCKIHFASKSCILLYWQCYCTALKQ